MSTDLQTIGSVDVQRIHYKVTDEITRSLESTLDRANNLVLKVQELLGLTLEDNQVEIVQDVLNLDEHFLTIAESRGAGKSVGVGIGLLLLMYEYPELPVGVFGPKEEQAKRLVSECTRILTRAPIGSPLRKLWSAKDSGLTSIKFKNGSYMQGLSAAETTLNEGWHFSVLVCDESHRIADVVFAQRLMPMVGSLAISKVIQLGITMYKNHFYSSHQSNSKYKKIWKNWRQCSLLLKSGILMVDGVCYPKFVIDIMPLVVKERLFPDHPELHYPSTADMSELDFKTQYEMEWVEDLALFLSSEDQQLILGTHSTLERGLPGVYYAAGLDLGDAGQSADVDFTVLSIWRKTTDGIKEKIAVYEWQGKIIPQLEEIDAITNPIGGKFPCDILVADGTHNALAVEQLELRKLPTVGLTMSATEPNSHRNYKNALYYHFLFELQSKHVKYPPLDKLDRLPKFKKGYNEWCTLERERTGGLNDRIEAPNGYHDDHTTSDVLAVWGCDKLSGTASKLRHHRVFPTPISGGVHTMHGSTVRGPYNPKS